MSSPVNLPGHSSPGAGFEAPLEMLSACHHRVERQCSTLQRLVPHVAQHGADTAAREAAAAVMRYFDTAAVDHHADEETDLFPALIESMAGSDAVCIRELTERLCAEHRQIGAWWQQRLRPRLQAVVQSDGDGPAASASAAGVPLLVAADVEPFITMYQRHIALEDAELLPMAARLLSDDSLQQVGRAMRLRRGITHIG